MPNEAARDQNDLMMSVKLNKKRAEQIQNIVNDIYKRTHYTDTKDSQYLDAIRRNMDYSINGLIDKTKLRTGETNMSAVYARTLSDREDAFSREIQHTLQDETMLADIMDLYSQNIIIRDQDREIDLVCKYLPKLDQALDIKVDHIMTADHFNKESLIIKVHNGISANTDGTVNSSTSQQKMKNNIDAMKKKYDLERFSRKLCASISKYGEQFIYRIPYKKALSRLIAKNSGNRTNLLSESGSIVEETMNGIIDDNSHNLHLSYIINTLNEDTNLSIGNLYDRDEIIDKDLLKLQEECELEDIDIEINTTGVIPSILKEQSDVMRLIHETSNIVNEAEIKVDNGLVQTSSFLKDIEKNFKKFSKNSLKAPNELSNDGFSSTNRREDTTVDIPGCIVENLEHTMVKPIYLRNIPLGYYYIESDMPLDENEQTTFSSTLGGLRPRRSQRDRENMTTQTMDNTILIKLARQISKKIDKKFINANQDIAKEIYTILKYNADHANGKVSKIRISFIPPEDIVHCYFDINDKTHRGISDLSKSMFPAKLYSCLYISNSIALLTRGYDKRVYYVKQAVDTNITAVLLNVVNQIKQSNFNLRQIENMNNILNITGRFNDLVVPRNANGESPVDFEVMPGQNIEVKTDFMNMLEEMAVNQTGVTMDMVNSRLQESVATHITMTNTRFLIKVFARQQLFSEILSTIFTKIYQTEYETDDVVEVELPPPIMLNFTNTSQSIAMVNELVQNIDMMEMPTEQDEMVKAAFRGKLMRYYLNTILPIEDIERLRDEAKIQVQAEKQPDTSGIMANMQQNQISQQPDMNQPQQDPNNMGGGQY